MKQNNLIEYTSKNYLNFNRLLCEGQGYWLMRLLRATCELMRRSLFQCNGR